MGTSLAALRVGVARWELIAILLVMACDLTFNGARLWQHVRESQLVADQRLRLERHDGSQSVQGAP